MDLPLTPTAVPAPREGGAIALLVAPPARLLLDTASRWIRSSDEAVPQSVWLLADTDVDRHFGADSGLTTDREPTLGAEIAEWEGEGGKLAGDRRAVVNFSAPLEINPLQ